MGSLHGHLPIEGNYSYHSARRKNQQRAKAPEELIVEIPTNRNGDDVAFLVNTNPHVSGKDTLKPYRDAEHPTGIFASWREALERAKKVFTTQQDLRNAHAKAMRDTVIFTNQLGG